MSESSFCTKNGFVCDLPADKLPMHPEDYAALMEWARAKEEEKE